LAALVVDVGHAPHRVSTLLTTEHDDFSQRWHQ
jgi:hypothetical protein